MATSYFQCNGLLVELKFCPLENYFVPLAASSELPIMAGDTLYPSADHFIAAQLFRDINRLDAAKDVPKIKYGKHLRRYIRSVVSSCNDEMISDWRETKMFHALKVATQLKFAQYPELKALLMQTGYSVLLDSAEDDVDWGIGMKYDEFTRWMHSENLSILALTFWLLHSDYKPGIIGSNLNGKLLMILRQELMSEAGIELKFDPKINTICKVCTQKLPGDEKSCADHDQIMLINSPKSMLSFQFPILFLIDGRFYENIDAFIAEKCKKLNYGELNADHLLSLIEIGAITGYSQNRLLRQSLLKSGDALLVDVRNKGEVKNDEKNELVRQFALNFGAFWGDFNEFRDFIERVCLTPRTLKLWWDKETFRLREIGRNKIGLLLMDIREKLKHSSFNISTLREEIEHFEPAWRTLYQKNSENFFSVSTLTLRDEIKHIDDQRNPLNRFFHAAFEIDGVEFLSVEHFFWWKKMQNLAPRRFLDKLMNKNARHLRSMCDFWLASNTPVEDEEGEASETHILLEGSIAKFEQNPAFCCYLIDDLSVLVDGNESEVSLLCHYVKKWGLNTKLLMCWWLDKFGVKPPWLCENSYGLILMKIRQNFIDSYFKRTFSNVISLEKELSQHCDYSKYYIISDDTDSNLSQLQKLVDDQNIDSATKSWQELYDMVFENCAKIKPVENLDTTDAEMNSIPSNDKLDEPSAALFSAFRLCGPAFLDLLNKSQNDEEAFNYGRQLAAGFDKLFADRFEKAANGFSIEDLHNIGRISGFEQI